MSRVGSPSRAPETLPEPEVEQEQADLGFTFDEESTPEDTKDPEVESNSDQESNEDAKDEPLSVHIKSEAATLLAPITSSIQTQQTQATTMSTNTKEERGPPMAAPTAFDGNRKNTRKFMHECNLYIQGKPTSFEKGGVTDDNLKIAFVLSYMNKGIASTWAQRYQERKNVPAAGTYDSKIHKARTYKEFEKLINETFKEHQLHESARLRLDALRQKDHSVDVYNEEFNALADDTEYDQKALVHLYLKGLNQRIENQIMLMENIPTDLFALQDKASTFDLRRNNYYNRDQQSNQRTSYPGKGTRDDPLRIDRFVTRTPEELERLKADNACFKCGKKGHIARKCWSGRNNRSPQNSNQGGSGYPRKQGGGNIKTRIAEVRSELANMTPEEYNDIMMDLREVEPKEQEPEEQDF